MRLLNWTMMPCTWTHRMPRKVLEVFSELEFKTLVNRVLWVLSRWSGHAAAKADHKGPIGCPTPGRWTCSAPKRRWDGNVELADLATIDTVPHRYFLAHRNEDLYMLAAQLKKQPRFCFDTETTGTDERTAELVGLAFSWKPHEGHYVPIPEDRIEAQRIVDIFKPVLENEGIGKVAQNAKYDIRVLAKYGVRVKGPLFDTMVAHFLLKPDVQKHGMDYLSETYLGYRPVSISTLIGEKGRGKVQKSMRDVDVEVGEGICRGGCRHHLATGRRPSSRCSSCR
jgi:DNA polymerase-1